MPKHSREHLLVIRMSAMGDVAMTIPVLHAFQQAYPEVSVTVVSKPFMKPIFDLLPGLEFAGADVKGKHRGLSGIWALSGELSSRGITAVADLHHVLRSRILRQFLRMRGIPFAAIDKGRAEKKALVRAQQKVFKPLKSTHQRYAEVFEKLGFPVSIDPSFRIGRRPVPQAMAHAFALEGKPVIGIAPFAAFKGKMYPEDLMQKVIQQLSSLDYQIILFGGGKQEAEILDQWSQAGENIHSAAGILSFAGELDLMSNLDAMLAMDSGNAHLAALFGIPVVTLWGVTHPYAGFYPFGQDPDHALLADREQYPMIPTSVYGNKFPPGYEDAMRSITPEQVVEKISKVHLR